MYEEGKNYIFPLKVSAKFKVEFEMMCLPFITKESISTLSSNKNPFVL